MRFRALHAAGLRPALAAPRLVVALRPRSQPLAGGYAAPARGDAPRAARVARRPAVALTGDASALWLHPRAARGALLRLLPPQYPSDRPDARRPPVTPRIHKQIDCLINLFRVFD